MERIKNAIFKNVSKNRKYVLLEDCIKISQIGFVIPRDKRDNKYYAYIFLYVLQMQIVIFGILGHMLHYLKNNDFNYMKVSNDIAGMFSASLTLFVFLANVASGAKLDDLLFEIGNFTIYEKPEGIERIDKLLNRLTQAILVIILLPIFLMWLYKLSNNCEHPEDYPAEDCGLVINAYLPGFDFSRKIVRQIFVTIQLQNALCFMFSSYFSIWLIICISELLVNRLTHLKKLIQQIPHIDKKIRRPHVIKCIKYHQKIIQLMEELIDYSKYFMPVYIPLASIVIALITYQLLQAVQFPAAIHVLLWFSNMCIIAFFGQRIIEHSVEIRDVAYDSIPWDGDFETQKSLLLVMIRSTRPLGLPAGISEHCDHNRLLQVVKGSYSFITLLLNKSEQ